MKDGTGLQFKRNLRGLASSRLLATLWSGLKNIFLDEAEFNFIVEYAAGKIRLRSGLHYRVQLITTQKRSLRKTIDYKKLVFEAVLICSTTRTSLHDESGAVDTQQSEVRKRNFSY